jgi:hypothetical protein
LKVKLTGPIEDFGEIHDNHIIMKDDKIFKLDGIAKYILNYLSSQASHISQEELMEYLSKSVKGFDSSAQSETLDFLKTLEKVGLIEIS